MEKRHFRIVVEASIEKKSAADLSGNETPMHRN